MMPRKGSADGKAQRPTGAAQFSRAHNTEAIARAKGASTGPGTGGKSNLAGQIIPIYGFGILLYILYILFKVAAESTCTPSHQGVIFLYRVTLEWTRQEELPAECWTIAVCEVQASS